MSARLSKEGQPAAMPAADLEAIIAEIAAMDVYRLRVRWRERHGADPPAGLTKDLIARALTYDLQEAALGGLRPQTSRLLRDLSKTSAEPPRQVKAGSVIVREFQGVLHEVLVIPGGFCWQGKTFDNLSTIAKRITGTSWNGPRFFGLRGKTVQGTSEGEPAADHKPRSRLPIRAGRRSSIGKRSAVKSSAEPRTVRKPARRTGAAP
jgi:hypothetical protein